MLTAALLAALLLHASATPSRAGSPGGGTARGGRSDEERELATSREAYVETVREQLQRHLFYPDEARRDRLVGKVIVGLVLNADGGVVRATIASSTGHAVLDRAAISMVIRAAPFPAVPSGLPSPITLKAPIRFEVRHLRRTAPAELRCRQGPGARGSPRSCR